MSIPEQSGDSFDFCVLFRVYFTGKGADAHVAHIWTNMNTCQPSHEYALFLLLRLGNECV